MSWQRAWTTLIGAIDYGTGSGATEKSSTNNENEDIKTAGINIVGSPGALCMTSDNGRTITAEKTIYSPAVTSASNGQTVRLTQNSSNDRFMAGSVSNLDIRISKNIPTNIEIESVVSDISADLSDVKLQSLLIDSNARSIELKLGDELDDTKVTIETAGAVAVRVPSSSGVKLIFGAGLRSEHLPDGYQRTGDDTYTSPGYDTASKKVTIDVDAGASSFKLMTY